ncbi:Spo0E family sporulation regulatory protein-aspartic acid phosphatase [Paenibacillus aurantiacus]|uniref:Spo0E family sporulation regulatory protein-aspartic acid phosphatase n=1 Tax=Paenibacillus aurantiacus TaxID=1936118 RepID=A0ABV5KMG8_9BACL
MDKEHGRLERMRGELVEAAARKKTFLHRDVLLLSQSLDLLIVKAQAEKIRRLKGTNATGG